jgi:DNA-directed RNA polymerase subunit RPC12/RpoP
MGVSFTFEMAAKSPQPLGIECSYCFRRVLMDARAVLGAQPGDKRDLGSVLHCSKCGSKRFTVTVFPSRAKATAFLRNH